MYKNKIYKIVQQFYNEFYSCPYYMSVYSRIGMILNLKFQNKVFRFIFFKCNFFRYFSPSGYNNILTFLDFLKKRRNNSHATFLNKLLIIIT